MTRADKRFARCAFTLLEAVIALALFALLGIALLEVLSTGARAAASAGEHQLASLTGARAMDRVLARGYDALHGAAGSSGELDLAREAVELAADGISITGRHAIEELEPGLLMVTVTLEWRRAGTSSHRPPATLSVTRYLADPGASMRSGASAGGRTA